MHETKSASRHSASDAKTVANALNILASKKKRNLIARLLPFMGPAFIASVAYVDPGNFATNIQGGAQFGYLLIWVIVASNAMAMVVQALSAKLGLVTGMNLAEHCREQFPKPVVYLLWALMEIVAMSTDLAEFLGAALGFQLLMGVPLLAGAVLTGIATMLILGLERYGFRPLEAVISSMVAMIALCYVAETFIVMPEWGLVLKSTFVPRFAGADSVYLACGILGATVMPHAIFLHSALMQGRIVVRDRKRLRSLYRFELADVVVAMGIASCVNAAMLMMAAATFHRTGHTSIASIEEAYRTLQPLLGSAARWIFGLSLLISGLSSSTVGTGAGQVIMQGFLERHIPIWLRRLITMLPSLIVIGVGLDPTKTLVSSQVVLSFGLPFAVIPLVMFTSRADIMREMVNRRITTAVASVIAAIIVLLNVYLIYKTVSG